MQILLRPCSLCIHFRSSVFYEFDDKYLSFISVLDLSLGNVLESAPSIMIRTPWGIVSVKRGVARVSCYFTKNSNFAYIKHVHFAQKL